MTKGKVLFSVLTLAGLAVPVQAAVRGFDAVPLLQIRFDTLTIAAERTETSVVIHASGAVEWREIRERGPALVIRAVVPPQELAAFNRALATGRIGVERGGCGGPAPDGPLEYAVTWYGKGSRSNTFHVGGNPSDCPARTRDMVFAVTDFLLQAIANPEKEVFPRPPG